MILRVASIGARIHLVLIQHLARDSDVVINHSWWMTRVTSNSGTRPLVSTATLASDTTAASLTLSKIVTVDSKGCRL